MRTSIKLALGASALALAAPASAATVFFNSGNYGGPNPLTSPDVLEIDTGANKGFANDFTNLSGTVNWRDGTIFLSNGAVVDNQSNWNIYGDNTFTFSSGGGTFVNSGVLTKFNTTGNTTFGVVFTNNNIIDAQTGAIRFTGGFTSNDGSQYLGAGAVRVSGNSTFNGSFTSENLELDGGIATGNSAVMNGTTDWNGGTISGSWEVASGGTFNILTGANKSFTGADFVNSGTLNWNGGTIFLGNSAAVTNDAQWNLNSDNSLTFSSGAGSFTNNGTLSKTVGTASDFGTEFVNNGTIEAQAGAIRFVGSSGSGVAFNDGSVFTGAGSVEVNTNATFRGGFTSDNANLNGSTYTGDLAVLTGQMDWTGGALAGGWTVSNGSVFDIGTGANKSFTGADFINSGTVNWNGGTIFLGNSAAVTNDAQWNLNSDNSLTFTSGAGSFTNNGTLSKTVGTISDFGTEFVNDGTIEAQAGAIRFVNSTGSGVTFNDGSVFTGAGAIDVNTAATFNGGFSSSNLNLNNATFTGNMAVLNGTADWTSGALTGGWTVSSGSTLNILTPSSKTFSASDFANSGTVNWADGTIFLQNSALVTNGNQWNLTGDNSLTFSSGAGTFVNDGTLSKTAGVGTSSLGTAFINNGTIDAQTGSINFVGSTAPGVTFNDGSVFTGAGAVNVNTNASFAGSFTSGNLNLNGSSYDGDFAVLNGTVDWTGGNLTGEWTVANGATFNITSSGSKSFTGTDFTNLGSVVWDGGTIFLANGAALDNQGTLTLAGNNSLTFSSGAGSLTNNGLIEKTGGGGTSTIGVPFDNEGTMNVTSGTIALPANFTNDGTMAGTGSYSLSGTLTNNGAIAPGDIGATGTLALTGSYAQTAGGALASQLFSMGSFDLFNITGTATLDGTLALSCLSGCMVMTGDSYVLLDSVGALSGMFSNVTTSGFNTGFQYDLIYDYDADLVRLTVLDAGMPLPGGVPEPSAWALLILGFGTIGRAMRRKRVAFRLV